MRETNRYCVEVKWFICGYWMIWSQNCFLTFEDHMCFFFNPSIEIYKRNRTIRTSTRKSPFAITPIQIIV